MENLGAISTGEEVLEHFQPTRRELLSRWRAGEISDDLLTSTLEALDRATARALRSEAAAEDWTLRVLDRLVLSALERHQLSPFLREMALAVVESCEAVDFALVLVQEGAELKLRGAVGLGEAGPAEGDPVQLAGALAEGLSQSDGPTVLGPGQLQGAPWPRGAQTAVVAPLQRRGKALGVLVLGSRTQGRLAGRELRLARALAGRMTQLLVEHMLLHEVEAEREAFVHRIVHDLKSPLSTMRGLAHLAAAHLAKAGHPAESARLRKLDRQVMRMTQQLNDLRDVRLLMQDRLVLEPIALDYREFLGARLDDWQSASPDHPLSLTFHTEGQVKVRADPERMRQVVGNLLGNAIKFSPYGGPVSVEVYAEGDFWVTQVQDSGVGLNDARLKSLFSDKPIATGKGLGLFVASEILRLHGGRIWATSGATAGATFCFALPSA